MLALIAGLVKKKMLSKKPTFDDFSGPIDQQLVSLFGCQVYAIGGRVRDGLINRYFGTSHVCKDFDYVVVGHTLESLTRELESIGARVDPVGASFAILKVTINGTTIDVALPRRENSTGTGHRDFQIDFGPEVTLQDDQMRRDFTINALSIRLSDGQIITAPGAIDDLQSKTIRALTASSFQDDPLRMVRAVQFASRLGFSIEPATMRMIRANADLLATVSVERLNEELCKMLTRSSRPSVGIRLLVELGLMPYIIPEILESLDCAQNKYHSYTVFGHLCATLDAAAENGGDLIDRLAALLHDIGKPRTAAPRGDGDGNTFYGHEDVGADMTSTILRRLRFAEPLIITVVSLIQQHMFVCTTSDGLPLSDAAVRRLMRRIGIDRIERQFALREWDMRGSAAPRDIRRAKVVALHERIKVLAAGNPPMAVAQLTVNGRDVIDHLVASGAAPRGFRGDRRVGAALNVLLEVVVDQPELNERPVLLQRLSSILGDC